MAKPLERAVAIAAGDGQSALEGIYLAGAPERRGGAVVAPPHPLYGGSMDSPVVSELCFGFQAAGLDSLRFNWRGVGASAGRSSGEAAAADADYAAAMAHLAETAEGPLVAAGYSFGAAAALRAAGRPRVERLVLVAPPPALLEGDALAAFRGKLLLLVGEHDAIAPPAALEARAAGAAAASLQVIPGADHFFGVGLAALSRALGGWL